MRSLQLGYATMKLFWIGSAVGLALGVGLTFIYYSLATLFSANAKASLRQRSNLPLGADDLTAQPGKDEEKARSVGV